MLEVLEFVTSGFWRFIGCLILFTLAAMLIESLFVSFVNMVVRLVK